MSVVLIADDEEAMLELFAQIVEDLGHQALVAHDGEEALLLARSHVPHLILSDHMMPRRTGMELLEALRADAQLAAIPFVLLSAARPRGLEQATRFLAKPMDLDAFEALVESALQESGQRPSEGAAVADLRAARSAGSVREEMLNWVAHEIKTPLSTARINAQMLQRKQARRADEAGGGDEGRHTDIILRQLDRMDALVSSILDAARLADGKVQLALARADLGAFLERLACDWREAQPQVDFQWERAPGQVDVLFDAERLRLVVDNLLSNAVKYGGEARRVHLRLSVSPGLAQVAVRDWGVGMAASEVPHVFDRFHRAAKDGGNGHGLGLYIAAALARLHGGSLSVQSALGEGSTFLLRLPLAA